MDTQTPPHSPDQSITSKTAITDRTITSNSPVPGITITCDTPNRPTSTPDLTVIDGDSDPGATPRLPVARHITAILDEYRQVLKHRSRLRLRFLDTQRTLAGLPASHARYTQTLADLDLLRVNIEVDSSLLTLLSLELRYASDF